MAQKSALVRALNLVDEFKKHHKMATASQMSMFLYVATHEGCTVGEVSAHVGVSQSIVSRTLHSLFGNEKQGSLGWMKAEIVHDPYKELRWSLTADGKRITRSIEDYLN